MLKVTSREITLCMELHRQRNRLSTADFVDRFIRPSLEFFNDGDLAIIRPYLYDPTVVCFNDADEYRWIIMPHALPGLHLDFPDEGAFAARKTKGGDLRPLYFGRRALGLKQDTLGKED